MIWAPGPFRFVIENGMCIEASRDGFALPNPQAFYEAALRDRYGTFDTPRCAVVDENGIVLNVIMADPGPGLIQISPIDIAEIGQPLQIRQPAPWEDDGD